MASKVHRTRTSHAAGLRALIDSGTTLTYLPFTMYAELWTTLLKRVAAARQSKRLRLLSDTPLLQGEATAAVSRAPLSDGGVTRVSGVTLDQMRSKLVGRLRWLQQLEAFEPTKRRVSRSRQDSGSPRLSHSEVDVVRRVLHDLEVATANTRDTSKTEEAQAQMEYIVGGDRRRLLETNAASDNDAEGTDPFFISRIVKVVPSAPSIRRLSPVTIADMEEECWLLPENEQDLK